jgi:hypothetical protein
MHAACVMLSSCAGAVLVLVWLLSVRLSDRSVLVLSEALGLILGVCVNKCSLDRISTRRPHRISSGDCGVTVTCWIVIAVMWRNDSGRWWQRLWRWRRRDGSSVSVCSLLVVVVDSWIAPLEDARLTVGMMRRGRLMGRRMIGASQRCEQGRFMTSITARDAQQREDKQRQVGGDADKDEQSKDEADAQNERRRRRQQGRHTRPQPTDNRRRMRTSDREQHLMCSGNARETG